MIRFKRSSVVAFAAVLASSARGQGASVVSGTVVDSATRQPVAGALVTVRSPESVFTERTDEAGAFRMPRLREGLVVAEVRRIGYRMKTLAFGFHDDTTLTIVVVSTARRLAPVNVLGKGEGVFGVIGRSADLKPINGAKVLVVGSGLTVTTDSAGEFFVPLKHPGSYLVRVTAEGFGEEVLPLVVKKNEVVESSQLLDASDRKPLSAGLWDDFDQRLRWRPIASALISGAEIRAAGPTIGVALLHSPSMVHAGLRLGPVCLFVNGQPRPGVDPSDIRVEEVRAIEVYSDQKKDEVDLGPLKDMWPKNISCGPVGGSVSQSGVTSSRGRNAPIPRIKWVVVWLR